MISRGPLLGIGLSVIAALSVSCAESKKDKDKDKDKDESSTSKGDEKAKETPKSGEEKPRKAPAPAPAEEPPPPPANTGAAQPDPEYRFLPLEKISDDPAIVEMLKRLERPVKTKKVRKQWESVGKKKAAKVLLLAMRSPKPNVRSQAAQVLRRMKHKSSDFTSLLSRMLLSDPDPDVRGMIAKEMVWYRSKKNVPALIIAIGKDTEETVRNNAAWALGASHDPRGAKALIGVLEDSSTDVRLRAVHALGRIRAKSAVPYLVDRLEDSNQMVRTRALDELKKLTGKNLGPSKAAWRKVYRAPK